MQKMIVEYGVLNREDEASIRILASLVGGCHCALLLASATRQDHPIVRGFFNVAVLT